MRDAPAKSPEQLSLPFRTRNPHRRLLQLVNGFKTKVHVAGIFDTEHSATDRIRKSNNVHLIVRQLRTHTDHRKAEHRWLSIMPLIGSLPIRKVVLAVSDHDQHARSRLTELVNWSTAASESDRVFLHRNWFRHQEW